MGPRSDFSCLSPKCRQDGAATVYEDLPVNTTRCPVCGSKRIVRLYNHVNVALGAAAYVDRAVAPEWERIHGVKESARAAERNQRAVEDRLNHERPSMTPEQREHMDKLAADNLRIHALPMRQFGPQYVGRDASGKAHPAPNQVAHPMAPVLPTLRQRTTVSAKAVVDP